MSTSVFSLLARSPASSIEHGTHILAKEDNAPAQAVAGFHAFAFKLQEARSFMVSLNQFQVSGAGTTTEESTFLVLLLVVCATVAVTLCCSAIFIRNERKEPPTRSPWTQSSQDRPMSQAKPSSSSPFLQTQGPMGSYSQASLASPQATPQSFFHSPPDIGRLPGHQRTSTPQRTPSPQGDVKDDVLCPQHVVENQEGITFEFTGLILPHQQEETAEVTSMDHESGIVLRIFISEQNRDGGVLLESALRYPLAYLDTSSAVGAQGSPLPAGNRQVTIGGAQTYRGPEPVPAFAVVKVEGGTCTVRRGSSHGLIMYTIPAGEQRGSTPIIDAAGRQVASIRAASGGREGMTLWVAGGVDACMMICLVVASAKLS